MQAKWGLKVRLLCFGGKNKLPLEGLLLTPFGIYPSLRFEANLFLSRKPCRVPRRDAGIAKVPE